MASSFIPSDDFQNLSFSISLPIIESTIFLIACVSSILSTYSFLVQDLCSPPSDSPSPSDFSIATVAQERPSSSFA